MIKYDFTGKNVIVTGGSMGLGASICEEFAAAKANVVIADINIEEANKKKEELSKYGTKIITSKLDVSNYEEFVSLIEKVNNELGSIDILVNNAGICKSAPLTDMDVNECNAMVNINLNGTIYGCKAVLPIMKEQNCGKIVNISSMAAKLGNANSAVYATTKAGILELTACLAREYAPFNINVNCVLPGIIRTPLWENMLDSYTNGDPAGKDAMFQQITKDIPLGRPQEPKDIANAVLFLCTEEANNITAQNLGVDGGQSY